MNTLCHSGKKSDAQIRSQKRKKEEERDSLAPGLSLCAKKGKKEGDQTHVCVLLCAPSFLCSHQKRREIISLSLSLSFSRQRNLVAQITRALAFTRLPKQSEKVGKKTRPCERRKQEMPDGCSGDRKGSKACCFSCFKTLRVFADNLSPPKKKRERKFPCHFV